MSGSTGKSDKNKSMMFYISSPVIKLVCAIVCVFALWFFFMPIRLGITNIGNIFGIFIASVLLIYFVLNKPVCKLLTHICTNRFGKAVVFLFVGFLITGFITAIIMSGFMIGAIADKPENARPAILLGCKVNGSSPSLMLGRRLDAAYEYLTEFEDAVIIVSGGKGDGEDISEAECMRRYLVDRGVNKERIFSEDKSKDTYQNINFSKKILEENSLGDEVVIITDSFHQFRASLIAKDAGLDVNAVSANTPSYLLPTYWVREWFGIVEQIVFK